MAVRAGSGVWRSVLALAVMVVSAAWAGPLTAPAPVSAQVKDLTGVYDVMEADSAEPFVIELTQTGNTVSGNFTRGEVSGTLSGSNSIPKLVGDWRGDDGSRGSFDMDIFPNAPRLEGLWRFEAPAPSLRKHIWTQRLGVAPRPPGQAAANQGGSDTSPQAQAGQPAQGTSPAGAPAEPGAAPAAESAVRAGPVFAVAANLAVAATRAAGDGDAAEIRARLAQVKQAVPQTGLPFDMTLIDIALTTLDTGAAGSAVAPTLQAALAQYQQVADAAR